MALASFAKLRDHASLDLALGIDSTRAEVTQHLEPMSRQWGRRRIHDYHMGGVEPNSRPNTHRLGVRDCPPALGAAPGWSLLQTH